MHVEWGPLSAESLASEGSRQESWRDSSSKSCFPYRRRATLTLGEEIPVESAGFCRSVRYSELGHLGIPVRSSLLLTITALLTAATPAVPPAAPTLSPMTATAWKHVDQGPLGPHDARHPLKVKVPVSRGRSRAAAVAPAPTGYGPATIRKFLGLTGTGAGQTIAVVSAYDSPNAASDLAVFDKTFGLPAPPSFKKVSQTGTTKLPVVESGWALESNLDIQLAHALAPAASLLLVEARSSRVVDLEVAIDYAARQPGVSVISNSWG